MAKPKAPAKKAKSSKGKFTLTVSVNDVVYKGAGATAFDVLNGFVASSSFPVSVKTSALITLSDGKQSASQRYSAVMASRMFRLMSTKPSAVEIVGRKLEQRMA